MESIAYLLKKFPVQIKFIVVAVGFFCAASTASASSISSVVPSLWKGDKSAAVTFSFDDGFLDTFNNAVPYLTSNGLRGTQYVVNSFNGITWDGYTTDGTLTGLPLPYASSSVWASAKANGHEIASHTVNHTGLAPSSVGIVATNGSVVQCTDPTYLTYQHGNQSWMDSEVHDSVQALNSTLGQNTVVLAFPGGLNTQEVRDCLKQDTSPYKILTARTSDAGINSSSPDFYDLMSEDVQTGTLTSQVDAWMDSAVAQSGWLILMYHIVGPNNYKSTSDGSWYAYYTPTSEFQSQVDYAVSQSRNIWVDTHGNVFKYIAERNATFMSGAVNITGSNAFTANAFGLDTSIYNVRLTFAIRLSSDWGSNFAIVSQGGSTCKQSVGTAADGTPFLFANVYPNGQAVSVTIPAAGDTTPTCPSLTNW